MTRACWIVLAVWLFAGVQSAPHDDLDDKIMGGRRAGDAEYPYIVSLQAASGGMVGKFCGASVVDRRWILTAAHCYNEIDQTKEYIINAGVTDAFQYTGTSQHIRIVAVLRHPQYDPNNVESHNDITLLKLEQDLVFNKHVQPIPLAPRGYVATGPGVVLGWGAIEPTHQSDSRQLLSADVVVVPTNQCQQYHPVDGTQVCIGGTRPGVSSCAGDSGGPFAQILNGVPTLVGATSYGSTRCGTAPVVYTNVASFRDWIDNVMRTN